jgi:hypothetical protein
MTNKPFPLLPQPYRGVVMGLAVLALIVIVIAYYYYQQGDYLGLASLGALTLAAILADLLAFLLETWLGWSSNGWWGWLSGSSPIGRRGLWLRAGLWAFLATAASIIVQLTWGMAPS